MNQNTKGENGFQLFARLVSSSQRAPGTQTQAQETPKQQQLVAGQTENMRPTQKNSEQMINGLSEMLMINKKLDLDANIFKDGGIANKELIEITGRPLSGKTELLIHLISRFILPSRWKMQINEHSENENPNAPSTQSRVVELDLSEISCHCHATSKTSHSTSSLKAILVDTESNFPIHRLYSVLESRLTTILDKQFNLKYAALKPTGQDVDHKAQLWPRLQRHLKAFIYERLKNLIIFQCFTNEQYIYALAALDHFMQNQSTTSASSASQPKQPASSSTASSSLHYILPVFIDTINSNYEFIDKYNSKLEAESYSLANVNINARNPATNRYDFANVTSKTENFAIMLIRKLIERHNACIIATRSDLSLQGPASERFNFSNLNQFKKWQTWVHQRVELVKSQSGPQGLADEVLDEENQGDIVLKSEIDVALQRLSVHSRQRSHLKVLRQIQPLSRPDAKSEEALKFEPTLENLEYKIDSAGFAFISKQ